jgi:hypothetical protein
MILSFAIATPLLSMSLPETYRVGFYIVFDSSVSFNIICGISMICCVKARHSSISKYFYHIICLLLLISRICFISSVNKNAASFILPIANSLHIGSMISLLFFEYIFDIKETIRNFESGQVFVFNSLENMKLANVFFHLFQYTLYGVLKVYYEYFNNDKFHYLNYTPLVIILFQAPTLFVNFSCLILPKRLDADIKKKLEQLVKTSINQREELVLTGEKLTAEVKKNEILLGDIFPKRIVSTLLKGEAILPEKFENATIFFSDIESFTKICLHADPMYVFILLNKLYTLMDYVATTFEVYKIETIGSA